MSQALAAEVVALEEARLAARSAELRAAAAARAAEEEAQSASAKAVRLGAERQSLAAAVSSLQVPMVCLLGLAVTTPDAVVC